MAEPGTAGGEAGEEGRRRGGGDAGEGEVGVCRVSLAGKVLEANDVMARMLGLERARDLVGRTTTDFYLDLDDRERLIRELLSRRTVSGEEVSVRKADGESARLVQSCRLEEDSSGDPVIEKRVAPRDRASDVMGWFGVDEAGQEEG